jgi:hypothetical protein
MSVPTTTTGPVLTGVEPGAVLRVQGCRWVDGELHCVRRWNVYGFDVPHWANVVAGTIEPGEWYHQIHLTDEHGTTIALQWHKGFHLVLGAGPDGLVHHEWPSLTTCSEHVERRWKAELLDLVRVGRSLREAWDELIRRDTAIQDDARRDEAEMQIALDRARSEWRRAKNREAMALATE